MKKLPAQIFSFLRSTRNALFFAPVLIAQGTTSGSCPSDEVATEVGCLPKDPVQFITSFYGIGLSLIGGVAVIFIIIGGYTILTSRGNPNQVNVGKSYILYSILGLLLAIFGYVFIEVFLVDILQLPGIGH